MMRYEKSVNFLFEGIPFSPVEHIEGLWGLSGQLYNFKVSDVMTTNSSCTLNLEYGRRINVFDLGVGK